MAATRKPITLRILRLPAVIEKTCLSRVTIYRGGIEGWFPRRIKISERASGWYEHEIDAYLRRCKRVEEVGAPIAPVAGGVTAKAQRRSRAA
jgi:prophage regulatory protein